MARKFIDGRRYDTETAQKIFWWSNGHFNTDFKYRSKTLYLTKNGNWFIYHVGGAMTDVAEQYGDSFSAGDDIEPVAADVALEFLQEHSGDSDAADAIVEFFNDSIVDA